MAVSLDIPTDFPFDNVPFEEWHGRWWQHPDVDLEISAVAIVDGTPVAISMLRVDRASGRAGNDITGTLRSHRGRGLATLLKQETSRRAAAAGVTVVVTGNDATNAPMLRVNEKLGYRPLVEQLSWVTSSREPGRPSPQTRRGEPVHRGSAPHGRLQARATESVRTRRRNLGARRRGAGVGRAHRVPARARPSRRHARDRDRPGRADAADGPFGPRSVVELDGYAHPPGSTADAPAGDVEPLAVEPRPSGRRSVVCAGTRREPTRRSRSRCSSSTTAPSTPRTPASSGTSTFSPPPSTTSRRSGPRSSRPFSATRLLRVAALRAALHDDVLPSLRADLATPAGREHVVGDGREPRGTLVPASRTACTRTRSAGSSSSPAASSGHVRTLRNRGFRASPGSRAFVRRCSGRASWDDPVPVAITCGLLEENLDSNEAIARRARRAGL